MNNSGANSMITKNDYELLDSGGGMKLERFGKKVLARPSSVCIWRPQLPESSWKNADATYIPGKQEDSGGWRFRGASFDSFEVTYLGCDLIMRLQTNGQVGLFPEHGTYLDRLHEFIEEAPTAVARRPRLLNLFAYTGLASAYFAKRGWEVVHVDLSKKALSWARENLEQNQIKPEQVKFICEDAVKYLEREVRRNSSYDAVIVDPPSFSRTSKEKFWKIEEVIGQIAQHAASLLADRHGLCVLTCHDPGMSAVMLHNLMLDATLSTPKLQQAEVLSWELGLPEQSRSAPNSQAATIHRTLPTGSFACIRNKI